MADKRGISGKALRGLDTPQGSPTFVLNAEAVAGTSSYKLVPESEFKFRVLDAWCVMTGAGASGDTWVLSSDGNDITDTVSVASAGDTDVVRAGELDDAYWDVAKHKDLTLTTASDALCHVFVLCSRS